MFQLCNNLFYGLRYLLAVTSGKDEGLHSSLTCHILGRWRCPQAGTCGPPACWGTQPPGQRRAPDTLPTLWSTSCRYVSQPCSEARSGADQVTSGSPSRSCHRCKHGDWVPMTEQLGCKIPILTAWKLRTCVCFEHLQAVCAHAGPKLKAKTQPHSFHGKFKNSRQTAETTGKWEAEEARGTGWQRTLNWVSD